jgi:hypothetical protein
MLPPAADHALLAPLLRAQHGAVSRVQALTCGLTDSGIAARLLSGRWQRAHQGVYLAFSGPVPRQARVWAALLRAGPGAVASHRTAAELEGLTGGPAYGPGASSELIHVTVPANRRIKPIDGVQIHYTRQLAVKRHPSLLPPRTRTEHTVLDLIDEAVTIDEVLTWVTRACQRRHTTPALLRSALALRSNVRWAAELAAVLSDVEDGAESVLEVEYRRRVERAHGLPPARRQRPPVSGPGRYVDVEYEDYRVRVELDGRIGHVEEGAFRDMDRDNATTIDGLDGLRYGWVHVFGGPCLVAGQVARVLIANGWEGRPRACGRHCRLPQSLL